MRACDVSGDGGEGAPGLAVHDIPAFNDLDLVGASVPFPHEMGASLSLRHCRFARRNGLQRRLSLTRDTSEAPRLVFPDQHAPYER